jgi:cytochrome oxidase assembly protein ShyY1
MKNNSLATALAGLLLVVALLTAWFAVSFNLSYLQLRRLQTKAAAYANNRALVQQLGNELVEYGKRNSAINPILQSVGLPTSTTAAPAGSPKPATR